MAHKKKQNNFTMYDPDGREFYDLFMTKTHKTKNVEKPRSTRGKHPVNLDELYGMFCAMQDENLDLRETVTELKINVNRLLFENAKLSSELEALDQYSRRENVCFTNLKVDDANTCEKQVIELCHELGVDVTADDLVAAHPLPGKKANRFIARFKDRANAQKVFVNRKQSKVIAPDKKQAIFADARKGVAVQPNITPKRAKLLAQVKDAVEKFKFDSCWVDPKNCNVMLRVRKGARPVPISCTIDLLELDRVENFEVSDFILCVDPRNLHLMSNFSPTSSPKNTGNHNSRK